MTTTCVFGSLVDIYKSCSAVDEGYIIRFSDDGPDYRTPWVGSIDHAICLLIDKARE